MITLIEFKGYELIMPAAINPVWLRDGSDAPYKLFRPGWIRLNERLTGNTVNILGYTEQLIVVKKASVEFEVLSTVPLERMCFPEAIAFETLKTDHCQVIRVQDRPTYVDSYDAPTDPLAYGQLIIDVVGISRRRRLESLFRHDSINSFLNLSGHHVRTGNPRI